MTYRRFLTGLPVRALQYGSILLCACWLFLQLEGLKLVGLHWKPLLPQPVMALSVAGMLTAGWLYGKHQEGLAGDFHRLQTRLQQKRKLLGLIEALQAGAPDLSADRLSGTLLEGLLACTDADLGLACLQFDDVALTGHWVKPGEPPGRIHLPLEGLSPALGRAVRVGLSQARAVLLREAPERLPEGWPPVEALACLPLVLNGQPMGLVLLGWRDLASAEAVDLADLQCVTTLFAQLADTRRRDTLQQELEATLRNNTAELASYAERLKLSNQALEEYAFIASHDLQEPLRKMQMLGGILRRKAEGQIDEECQLYLSRMIYLSRKMQSMISDVLTLSRVTTKMQPFRKVNMEALVARVLGNLEPMIQEHGARVEVGPLLPLRGEPAQIAQLMENLLENAIKFRQSQVPPHILIRMRETGNGYGEITVTDNGIGFEERYAARIFRIFERLHGENTYAGHGVGLAICRKVAEQHRGAIRAFSEPGKGATFTVTLPLASRSASPAPIHEAVEQGG